MRLVAKRRTLQLILLSALVFGSFGYSVSAYAPLRGLIFSSLSQPGSSKEFGAFTGINGSIAYDRGAVSCSIPFPDPQANVLVQGPDGKVMQVSVKWTVTQCDLKIGVFMTLVHPGKYHVSFTGYPLTLPPNDFVGITNLPQTVTVEPHRLSQVHLWINFGI